MAEPRTWQDAAVQTYSINTLKKFQRRQKKREDAASMAAGTAASTSGSQTDVPMAASTEDSTSDSQSSQKGVPMAATTAAEALAAEAEEEEEEVVDDDDGYKQEEGPLAAEALAAEAEEKVGDDDDGYNWQLALALAAGAQREGVSLAAGTSSMNEREWIPAAQALQLLSWQQGTTASSIHDNEEVPSKEEEIPMTAGLRASGASGASGTDAGNYERLAAGVKREGESLAAGMKRKGALPTIEEEASGNYEQLAAGVKREGESLAAGIQQEGVPMAIAAFHEMTKKLEEMETRSSDKYLRRELLRLQFDQVMLEFRLERERERARELERERERARELERQLEKTRTQFTDFQTEVVRYLRMER